MSEIDQQFIEFVVKSLVGKPDAVQVKRSVDEKGVLLELTVDPEDLGRVIGKRGATAQSLRTLLRALGTKNDARYNLKIIDNGPDDHGSGGQRRNDRGEGQSVSGGSDSEDTTPKPADDDVAAAADEPEEVAVEADTTSEAETPVEEETPDEDDRAASERLRKTREELADLDDLDV